ncbi:hypothetical protein KKA00_00970, partial [bacterium]|nr:hypothetical protein [bacterium]
MNVLRNRSCFVINIFLFLIVAWVCDNFNAMQKMQLRDNNKNLFRDSSDNWEDWRWQLRNRIRSLDEFSRLAGIGSADLAKLAAVTKQL